MNWSYKPFERLRQLSSLSFREREVWLQKIAPPRGYGSWPYGMPSSAAPLWIGIGLTPGGGNGNEKPPKCGEEPTFGKPAGTRPTKNCPDGGGLFWTKGTDYFHKLRSLFLKLGHLEDKRLSEDSCLALAGHFNLGTGQNGDGSKAAFEPQIIRWVSSLLANHFRPAVIVTFGWFGRLDEIAQHWNHANGLFIEWNLPKLIDFKDGKKTFHFRIWTGKNKKGDSVKIIGWPNHPRKSPFTKKPTWNRSLYRIPQLMNFANN